MKNVIVIGGGDTGVAPKIAKMLAKKQNDRGINIESFENKEVKQRLEIETAHLEFTPPPTRRERRAKERKLNKNKR